MSADNQQERPNYRICVYNLSWASGDGYDSFIFYEDIHASSDDDARIRAKSLISELYRKSEEEKRLRSTNDSDKYEIIGIKRLEYFLEEVEKTISISQS